MRDMNDVQIPWSFERDFNHLTKAGFGGLPRIDRYFASYLRGARRPWSREFNPPCDQIIEPNSEMHRSFVVKTSCEVLEKGRQGIGREP